jgi:SpoVK/Ycf46/Vps4 family AAA+-type ATPase
MHNVFPSGGYLLEIKSHSLFSKWFSESGKLISRLFGRIREMVEDEPDSLFCVLIDEIESLAGSRINKNAVAEPSDAIRAVNSLLTSLDSIRSLQNVIVLSTTNITDCIDDAFVNRVDWCVKIGFPSIEARYEILRSCVDELCRAGVISENDGRIESYKKAVQSVNESDPERHLLDCAQLAEGLSGRSLRKLPFQSHAFHVRSQDDISLSEFLSALKLGIGAKVRGEI